MVFCPNGERFFDRHNFHELTERGGHDFSPQPRRNAPERDAAFPGSSLPRQGFFLGYRLTIEEPPPATVRFHIRRASDAVLLTFAPPLLTAIGPFDSRAIWPIQFPFQIPELGAVRPLDSRAIWPMKLASFVSVSFDALPVDGESDL